APAGRAWRLRGGDGREPLGEGVPREGVRQARAGLAAVRRARPALLPAHRGRLPARRPVEGEGAARLAPEDRHRPTRRAHGRSRPRARQAGEDPQGRRAPRGHAGSGRHVSSPLLTPTTRIYVAGHRGMVGSAVLRRLERSGFRNLITRTSRELDLRDQPAVDAFFAAERPEVVILAAAKVGGILANATFPADFLHDNLR